MSIEELKILVRDAYHEGFINGTKEAKLSGGGLTWADNPKVRQRLEAFNAKSNEMVPHTQAGSTQTGE